MNVTLFVWVKDVGADCTVVVAVARIHIKKFLRLISSCQVVIKLRIKTG